MGRNVQQMLSSGTLYFCGVRSFGVGPEAHASTKGAKQTLNGHRSDHHRRSIVHSDDLLYTSLVNPPSYVLVIFVEKS